MGQRSMAFETSSGVYQRAFALYSIIGLGFLAFGALMIAGNRQTFGAVLCGLAVVFMISGIGMARASKRFKELAGSGHDKGAQS